MIKNPNTINQILAFVSSSNQTNDEKMAQYAKEFAIACKELNDRLATCNLFFETGHRAEAIRFSEGEPSLKQQVEKLQLNGMLDVWEDAVSTYGWVRFQPLKTDIVDRLNKAYEVENNLKGLLFHYRKLSLAKASLSDRLLVVRQIALVDRTNLIWLEDIEQLEIELMRQFELAGNEALRTIDMDRLIEIVTAHDQQDWMSTLSPSYRSFLEKAVPTVYRKYTIPKKTRIFANSLRSFGMSTLSTMRDEIRELFAVAKTYQADFRVKAQVMKSYNQAADTVTQKENAIRMQGFQHDIRKLQAMLGGKHTKHQIRDAKLQVEAHGIHIPPILNAQIEACESALRDTKILTNIVITSLIVLVVVLVVLGTLFMFQNSSREQSKASGESVLQQEDDNGRLNGDLFKRKGSAK